MRSSAFIVFSSMFLAAISARAEKPTLVVFISIDQLRGDMPQTYKDRFVEGGIRRFFEDGAVYTNAHFGHTTTYTASGHATLSTGGNPREHGLIGNQWIDASTGESIYCVQDTDHKILGKRSTRTSAGTSPKNMLVETIGDVLIGATDGKSKVFSVSRKDRSAILMGGHKGKAFWYDGDTGGVVTSTYYYDEYPKWVAEWNDAKFADRYEGASWNLLRERSSYVYRDRDEREVELTHPQIGADVRLIIGGSGPQREALQHLVAELKMEDRVELIGYVPDPELPRRYAEASRRTHCRNQAPVQNSER